MIDLILGAALGLSGASPDSTGADVLWEQRVNLSSDEERLGHAEDFIERFQGTEGADRLLIAHATAGEILWRRSCPVAGVLGACARWLPEESRTGTCDDGPGLELVLRNERDGRAAERHFDRVDALRREATVAADEGHRQRDLEETLEATHPARTAAEFERGLAREVPRGLNLLVETWKQDVGIPKWERDYRRQTRRREESLNRLGAFFAKTRRAAQTAGRVAGPVWGPARAGVVYLAARSLVLSSSIEFAAPIEISNTLVNEDQQPHQSQSARCLALHSLTAGPYITALGAFRSSVAQAAETGVTNDASRFSEAQLIRRARDTTAPMHEMVGAATSDRSTMQRYGVQTTIGTRESHPTESRDSRQSPFHGTAPPAATPLPMVRTTRSSATHRDLRVETRGWLGADVVAVVAAPHRRQLRSCLRTEARASAKIEMVINHRGRVETVIVEGDDRVSECVRRDIRRWRFPARATKKAMTIATVRIRGR